MERVAFNKTYIVVYCYAIVSSWAVELFCFVLGVWLDWCTEYGVWQYIGFVSFLITAGLTAWVEIEGLKLLQKCINTVGCEAQQLNSGVELTEELDSIYHETK